MMRYKTNTGRRLATLAALMLTAAAPALAAPALDTDYGRVDTWLSAEIAAMGGTGVALDRGGFGATLNPATLSAAGAWRLDAGTALAQRHEDRFQPLFDTFTSYITDTAIASNRHHALTSGFAASYGLAPGLGAGVSLTSRWDYTYDFREEVRDPDFNSDPRDRILADRRVNMSGSIRDLALGLGYAINDQVSVGVAAHYLFGTIDGEMNQRTFNEGAGTSAINVGWDADGFNLSAGLRVQPDERVVFGLALDQSVEVGGDRMSVTAIPDSTTALADGYHVRYPRRVRAGLAFHPRSEPRTVFTVEAVWSEWTQLEDTDLTTTVEGGGEVPTRVFEDNTMDYRVGLEHLFYNGVPVRFGFRHLDHYSDREAKTSQFAAGVGIPYAEGMIGVTAELSKVSSSQTHWFDYPAGFEVLPTSRVEETRFRLGATFTYRF